MYRFLCEQHFPSIYICRSQRRTLLLANAVPIPFNESNEEIVKSEMLEIVEGITEEMIDSEDLPEEFHDDKDLADEEEPAETITLDENKSTPSVGKGETISNAVELNREPSKSRFDYTRKRKHVAEKMAEMKIKLLNTTGSPKTLNKEANIKTVQLDGNSVRLVPVQISNNAQQQTLRLAPAVEKEGAADNSSNQMYRATLKSPVSSSTNAIEIIEQNDDTSTSKGSDDLVAEKDDKISEFIFKGEEYVQMPKEHFLKKINRLKRSLAFYENVIRNMRDVLDQADVSSSLEC
uniref:Uncharacterized protein n=1 Tax=Anopheles culicifacies TaxID=139723 RepID=A0A182LT30_9DIPT